jgi:hypothetical protein
MYRKGKVHPSTGHGSTVQVQLYFILSLISALDGGEWATHPNRFTSAKEILGGTDDRFGRVRKFLPQSEFDPGTFQPIADAMPAQECTELVSNITSAISDEERWPGTPEDVQMNLEQVYG